jgi:hypothetical protein
MLRRAIQERFMTATCLSAWGDIGLPIGVARAQAHPADFSA